MNRSSPLARCTIGAWRSGSMRGADVTMAASIAALVAQAVFWLVVLGMRMILRDSIIDPLPALVVSLCISAGVFRAVWRRRT